MYSSRFVKIVSICALCEEYITYQYLADMLDISTRTIMREINQNKDSLQKYHVQLHLKKGRGIYLAGSLQDKERLLVDLQGMQIEYMDKEERQELLMLKMLETNDIQKLFYYSNTFQVSQATISHDLDDVEDFFKENNMKIIRRPGLGIALEGSEENKRLAMSSIINRSIHRSQAHVSFDRYNVEDVISRLSIYEESNISKLLDFNIIKGILEVFIIHRKKFRLDYIAESSYMGLVIHLMIAISRILQGKKIKENKEVYSLINEDESYDTARQIASKLAKSFAITFPKIEVAFIAIHLQSAKTTMATTDQQADQYHDIILKFIANLNTSSISLANDYEFYQSIAAHLKPAMIRHKYHLPIYNPMLKQIKEDYQEVFTKTKQAAVIFDEMYGYPINDDEVGYLVLHVAAALERQSIRAINQRHIQVGIVCSSGIGMSALLVARIKRIVDNNVYLVQLSLDQVENSPCELYISTFTLHKENTILINPLLTQNDVGHILKAIDKKRSEPHIHETMYTPSISLITYLEEIKKVLETIEIHYVDNNLEKEDIIHYFASTLDNSKNIEASLLKREKQSSNVYPDFNFALLHASEETMTHCVCKCILPIKKPFTSQSLSTIRVVLCMLIPATPLEEQKRMMSYLSSLLIEEEGIIEKIETSQDIKAMFSQYLQQFIIKEVKQMRE